MAIANQDGVRQPTPAAAGARAPRQVKKGYKAPPGYELVKQPNGKYKLVKKNAAAKPGAAKPKGPVGPEQFVQNEINRQIAQDTALTNYTDAETAGIAQAMSEQANAAAGIAAQYAPVTAQQNATLDANAQQRIAADAGLTNAVGQDQAGALAGLIAKQGSAGTDLMGNMRGALAMQHRDYGRQLQGMRPSLELQRRNELREAALQNAQMQLAREQFGAQLGQQAADNAFRQENLDAQYGGGAGGGAAGEKPNKGIYGFGADRDEALGAILASWSVGIKPTQDKEGNEVPARFQHPWRDLHSQLVSVGGLNADQAALLATKSSANSIRNARGGARGVLAMLRARKVSPKVQAFIIKTYFGKETWAALSSNRRPGGHSSQGTYQPGASGAGASTPNPNLPPPTSPVVYHG